MPPIQHLDAGFTDQNHATSFQEPRRMKVDPLLFIAIGAFGWGFSLATYWPLAQLMGWPKGSWQSRYTLLPIILGLASLAMAFIFALSRDGGLSAWTISVLGLLFGLFWTGFLRVAAQTALILAPMASAVLALEWMAHGFGAL